MKVAGCRLLAVTSAAETDSLRSIACMIWASLDCEYARAPE